MVLSNGEREELYGQETGRVFLQAGNSQSGRQRDRLFVNTGDGFENLSGVSGVDSAADGRVGAVWDWNRDGLLDLAVVSANAPLLQVFNNDLDAASRTFLALRFVGGTAPYYHDGRFATLEALLRDTQGKMGWAKDLSDDDISALSMFLRTL